KAVAPVATARDSKERAKQSERARKPAETVAAAATPTTGAKSESPGVIHNDARRARVGHRASGGEGHHDGPSNAGEKSESPEAIRGDARKARVGVRGGGGEAPPSKPLGIE